MVTPSISRNFGSLFVKFLVAFWGALLLAYGLIHAVNQVESTQSQHRLLHSPQVRLLSQTARSLLARGGIELLQDVVKQWEADPLSRERLLVLNEQGQDILARPVPADWPAQMAAFAGVVDLSFRDNQGQLWQLLPVSREHPGAGAPMEPPLKGWSGHGPAPKPPSTDLAGPKPPFWFGPSFLWVIVLFASTVASLVLAWYFAAPVRKLQQALDRLAEQQWSTQLGDEVTRRHDEFGALGRSFNQMAQSVALAISSQRRLLHDVSHELRSPLARLQILVGLVRQDPTELSHALDRVEAETEKINRLVGTILTFSRLESGELQGQQQAVYVHELLESICDDAQLEADAAHKTLVLAPIAPVVVKADAELLYRAFENVVRNALKYTPVGASVTITAHVQQRQLILDIDDDGDGVADALLQRLFLPFFRGQSSHDGVGLGLSIAQRAVQAAGGEISAHNRYPATERHIGDRPCGFRIRIKLPIAETW